VSTAIHGLLKGPRVVFGRCVTEHWEEGKLAERRKRQLKKVLQSVQKRTYRRNAWAGDIGSAVEFTYHVPVGVVVPPPDAPEDKGEHDVCPIARTV
jgi:hypothetical protein